MSWLALSAALLALVLALAARSKAAAQAGLVQYFPDLRPVVVNSDAGSPDGTARVVVETEPP